MNKRFPLKIEKVALGGSGIGFAEGKAVFVPYTAVGDEIEAGLVRERKDMAHARVVKYERRGEGVIDSPCASFAAAIPCGGCDWLNIGYATQLDYKTGLVRELLKPLAPDLDIPETLASPVLTAYRNKAFLPVGERDGQLIHGIYSRWSHQIVTHADCQLHPPVFDRIASRCLQILSRSGVRAYDEARHSGTLRHIGFRCSRDLSRILLILVTRSGKLAFTKLLVKQLTEEFPALTGIVQNINRERGNVILGPEEKLLWGEPQLFDEVAGTRFRVHYRSFWQVNSATLELILKHLNALLKPDDVLFDAYAGIGALGLSLAGSVQRVLCIEENKAAVADGEANLHLNGIANAGFLCARTEDALPALLAPNGPDAKQSPDVIVLDPPRSGVRSEALQALIAARVPKIFYLSCSPITLHRDLRILLDSGAYRLASVQPFDMFPHTWHVETLAVLELLRPEQTP